MTRKLRLDPLDAWHHVMNRGVDRQPIFFSDVDRIEFGRCIALACRRFDVEVHAYCLMTNHFHLLVRCPNGHLSDVMHLACGLYAASANRRRHRVGHLFGDRFCSRLVTSDAYVATAVRYIHRNPLAIAGVTSLGDYRWSSHHLYLGQRRCPDFIRTEYVSQWFQGPESFAAFVDAPTPSTALLGGHRGDEHPAVHLLETIDMVIAEQSQLSGRTVLSQRRAVALNVAAQGPRSLLQDLLRELDIESSVRSQSAAYRARRHFDEYPASLDIVGRTLELTPIIFSAL